MRPVGRGACNAGTDDSHKKSEISKERTEGGDNERGALTSADHQGPLELRPWAVPTARHFGKGGNELATLAVQIFENRFSLLIEIQAEANSPIGTGAEIGHELFCTCRSRGCRRGERARMHAFVISRRCSGSTSKKKATRLACLERVLRRERRAEFVDVRRERGMPRCWKGGTGRRFCTPCDHDRASTFRSIFSRDAVLPIIWTALPVICVCLPRKFIGILMNEATCRRTFSSRLSHSQRNRVEGGSERSEATRRSNQEGDHEYGSIPLRSHSYGRHGH